MPSIRLRYIKGKHQITMTDGLKFIRPKWLHLRKSSHQLRPISNPNNTKLDEVSIGKLRKGMHIYALISEYSNVSSQAKLLQPLLNN